MLKIVTYDFIKNSELALFILKNNTHDPRFKKDIELANKVFEERVRRMTNKEEVYEKFKTKITSGIVMDKTKMKRLEQVKQQLKKPMR